MMQGSTFRQRKRARPSKSTVAKGSLVPVSAKQAEINLAQKVVKLTKLVSGLRPETKYIDTSLTSNNVSVNNGVVINLTAIAGGTGINQRVGDAVNMLWWNLNLSVTLSSAQNTTTEMPAFRFYIVRDLQQVSDTAPTGSDLVDQPSLPKIQLLNVATTMQRRFQIVYDSKPQLIFPGTGLAILNNSVVYPQRCVFTLRGSKKGPIRFNGTASTDIQKGGLYLFFYTDVTMSGDVLDFVGTSRVAYNDV